LNRQQLIGAKEAELAGFNEAGALSFAPPSGFGGVLGRESGQCNIAHRASFKQEWALGDNLMESAIDWGVGKEVSEIRITALTDPEVLQITWTRMIKRRFGRGVFSGLPLRLRVFIF
jgi:hypothetical protein